MDLQIISDSHRGAYARRRMAEFADRCRQGGLAVTPQRLAIIQALLATTDLHGNLLPFKVTSDGKSVEVGGIARIATLVKQTRAENDSQGAQTFVLVAGDILQGTPMSTVTPCTSPRATRSLSVLIPASVSMVITSLRAMPWS